MVSKAEIKQEFGVKCNDGMTEQMEYAKPSMLRQLHFNQPTVYAGVGGLLKCVKQNVKCYTL